MEVIVDQGVLKDNLNSWFAIRESGIAERNRKLSLLL